MVYCIYLYFLPSKTFLEHLFGFIIYCDRGLVSRGPRVRTGLIFGSYQYGNTLGLKLADVPITIGLNWIILLMSTNAVVEEWNAGGKIGKAALGAGLMTALDLLIEPVAVHFDFWHWSNIQVPVQNFVAWWVISFFFQYVYQLGPWPSKSSLFRLIALLQFLFFLGHWLLLQFF